MLTLHSTVYIFHHFLQHIRNKILYCLLLNNNWNNCFTDNIKVQYLQFMAHMKTPQYRSNLQQLLEQEKVRPNIIDIS